MILRYVARHIPRAAAKSLLSLLLAAALIAALGQFTLVVRANRARVEEMFDTVDVYARVVNRSGSVGTNVPYAAIELLLDAEFSDQYYAESRGPCYWVDFAEHDVYTIYNITDPDEFEKAKGITYAEGYDKETFLTSRDPLIFVSEHALEEYGLEVGGEVRITGASWMLRMDSKTSDNARYGITFTIAGTFKSGLGVYDVVTPFWSMYTARYAFYIGEYAGSGKAREVWFRIDNDLLRDNKDAYRIVPNELLAASENNDISDLGIRVMDEEVTNVVEPLERNTELLEMLLPIIAVVVLVIGAAIPGLVIIQSAKEAAIMRVLGTPKTKVRAILTLEQMILCGIGLIIGVVALAAAHRLSTDFMRAALETALYALAYLALATAACLGCSIAVSEGKPLELLQTKE